MTEDPHAATETYRATVVGPVAVCAHLRGEPDDAMVWLTENLTRMCRTESSVGAVLVLRQGAKPPDEASRRAFAPILRSPVMKGFGVVVLGGGFWAAAARSVVTFFVVSARLPVKLFTDGASARAWVSEQVGPDTVDAAALSDTVNAFIDGT